MLLLADWVVSADGEDHRIELYWGDLSYLAPQDAVDLLVVSAFPNDYMPTPTSLIGALARNGVSVNRLSFDKESDLRAEFACWVSRPVGVSGVGRILCVESGWRGAPPELADELFRAIAPISTMAIPTRTVAMPLIGAGDQGYPAGEMLDAVLKAAVRWFRRGMPIDVLKIVAYSKDAAETARTRFLEAKAQDAGPPREAARWDVFLSYSHRDADAADQVESALATAGPHLKVFRDKPCLEVGASWLMQLADAIDEARHIVALYTPDYWQSVYCKDELSAAYVRSRKSNQRILFPIYYRTATIPSFFQALHYEDCREADPRKLADTCRMLCRPGE